MTAFDEFYANYHTRVRALAARVFGSELADDIASQVMLQALERFSYLDHSRDVWPWLLVVTLNRGHDVRRTNLRWDALNRKLLASTVTSSGDLPAEHAVRADEAATVYAVLARLSDRDRTALRMHYLDDRSSDEIAQLTGVTVGACRQQMLRARRHFAVEYRRYLATRQALPEPVRDLRSRGRLRCARQTS